jgi:hypothetical protein
MEKSELQLPGKRPTRKHYLTVSLSVLSIGLAFLVYVKYQFINVDLRSLFHKEVTGGDIDITIDGLTISTVEAKAATALTLSPTSNVKGKKFDRFVTIWLENQDFEIAAADR